MSDTCLKGINFGKVKFTGVNLQMAHKDKQIFSIPIKTVQNCTMNKEDIVLEFTPNE